MLDSALRQHSNNNNNNNNSNATYRPYSYQPQPLYNQYQMYLRLWAVFKIASTTTLSLQFLDTYDLGTTLHPIDYDMNPARAQFGGAGALNLMTQGQSFQKAMRVINKGQEAKITVRIGCRVHSRDFDVHRRNLSNAVNATPYATRSSLLLPLGFRPFTILSCLPHSPYHPKLRR